MKFLEIKELNQVELLKKLNQFRKDLFESRMKLRVQRLPNPLTIRGLRKDIARVQTALSHQAKEAKVKGDNK